jgi:sugar phosphate isomerase/epimerase
MTNPVYVSLSAMGRVPVRHALARLWESRVQGIELAIGPRWDPHLPELVHEYRAKGIEFRAHHAFPWPGVDPSFDLLQSFSPLALEKRLDGLVAMGIHAYSVHGGRCEVNDCSSRQAGIFLENLRWLHQRCQERNILLGVETMFVMPPLSNQRYLLTCEQEISLVLTEVPELQLVVDLAHMNLWTTELFSERLHVLEQFSERIMEIHISDNDGRRDLHTAFSERCWWWNYRSLLPANIPVVVETRVGDSSSSSLEQQVGLCRNWLASPLVE